MPTVKITTVTTDDLVSYVVNSAGHQTDELDPVYVELDLATGRLTALCVDHSGGARPTPVCNGHVQWWDIEPMRTKDANALLKRLRHVAQRVVDGYLGGPLGDAARLTADAKKAIDEAVRMCDDACEEAGEPKIWRAAEWFGPLGSRAVQRSELDITSATTDERLQKIIAADEASDECDYIDGGLEYLQSLRAEAPR